jgi:hypothetical protein
MSANAAIDIFQVEEFNMRALGEVQRGHYLNFPPSHAVDGQSETAFCSLESELNSCSTFLLLYVFFD